MAEELLVPSEEVSSSEGEETICISDEHYPRRPKDDTRRGRLLCLCMLLLMLGSVVLGVLVALTVVFTIRQGYGSSMPGTVNTTLTVNTSTLERSGDWVLVSWKNVDKPSISDWIGLYSSPEANTAIDPTKHAPIKFQYANFSSTHMSEGRGSLNFRLINLRKPVMFALFRGGLNTAKETASFSKAEVLAYSDEVQFRNWNEPLQGHLALNGNSTEMILVWVTRDAQSPQVKWGTKSGQYTSTAAATSSTYNASSMCGFPATDFGYRDPGMLHQVTMNGLTPGQTYYYQFGDANFGWSEEFHFTAAQPAGPSITTRAVIYGDMGNGHYDDTWQVIRQQPGALNTTHTLESLVGETDLVFHIGDISYARGYANVWDEFFDEIESVAASVPYMVCIGNHERNWNESTSYFKGPDSGGECGIAYERRFAMPRPSLDEPWYSVDYGSVHFLIMSTEHNFTNGSIQYQFLENDLRTTDRSKTPWLVLAGHRPMYVYSYNDSTRYAGVQPVAKLLRENLEELLNEYKVDLALWGHEHTYQRMCSVYREQCVEGATVHVIVGMGGQKHDTSEYPKEKPSWLKYFDRQHYGLSRLTANATTLVLDYIINDGGGQVNDTLILTKS